MDGMHRNAEMNTFVVGDSAYMRTDGKCDSEWSGPHRVTKIISTVSLEVNSDQITRHVSHFKKVPRNIENGEMIKGSSSESSSESDSEQDKATSFSSDQNSSGDQPFLRSQRHTQQPSYFINE